MIDHNVGVARKGPAYEVKEIDLSYFEVE